jgi:putative peptidoglycan binding protein
MRRFAFSPPRYPLPTASFAGLTVAARYDVQMRLIVAGYSDAVSTDNFTERLYDSIIRFQSDNGFAANGSLTLDELVRLRQLSDPILRSWDLASLVFSKTSRRWLGKSTLLECQPMHQMPRLNLSSP